MRIRPNVFKVCAGILTIVLVASARAQAPQPPTATYKLEKQSMLTSELDPLGQASGKTGPTCTALVAVYADVMKLQNPSSGITPNGCDSTPLGIDYLIVNYVVWNANGVDKPSSAWYLLSPENPRRNGPGLFAKNAEMTNVTDSLKVGNRIFGSGRIGVLLVHRKFSEISHATVDYTVTVTHKKSVQANDLSSLIGLVGGAAKVAALAPVKEQALVSAASISRINLPDDIAFAGEAFLTPAAVAAAKPDSTFAQTYDDEGYSSWDISVAIPIAGIKDLQYTQVGSTVSAKTVTRANAYALAHYYPYKVDLKGDYPWQPSLVGGLALSGKPLDKPFVGIAIGTKKPFPFQVNAFAGAVFNKVFTSASATDATKLNSHRVTKLLYGIDIPIGKFITAIKGN